MSTLEELVEQLRELGFQERLRYRRTDPEDESQRSFHAGKERAFKQAAQMVEAAAAAELRRRSEASNTCG